MRSCLTHLECTFCGKEYGAERLMRTCPIDAKVLFARYDLVAAARSMSKDRLNRRPTNMWRYSEVMPMLMPTNIVTLGEGFTPLLRADRLAEKIGAGTLYIKDEGSNPTGSFKARGLSAAVSKALELGARRFTMPSAGNAGGALAAYAAAAGAEAQVYMPADAPAANRLECEAYGARLNLVDGLITDAGKLSAQAAEEHDLFDVSTLREPYRAEGKKTMGYEIAEQLVWSAPDVIVYPTGGGTGIVGIWKAFEEMEALGWVSEKRPRMISVQAEGCAPIVQAFRDGKRFADPFPNASTAAAGLRVPAAIGDYLILDAIRESGGDVVTVTDDEMMQGVRKLAGSAGVFAAPEGGATLAALEKLLASGVVTSDERVVLLNTGSALKYLDVIAQHPS